MMSRESGLSIESPSRVSELFDEKKLHIQISPQEREKYGLFAVGKFKEDDVNVTESEREALKPEEEEAKLFVDNYVKDFVERKNKILAEQGKRLIGDWPKLHVSGVVEAGDKFEMNIQRGVDSYANLIALGKKGEINVVYKGYTNTVAGEKIPFNRFKELFQPTHLTVAGLIFTADNYILMAKRHPDKVGTYGEAWHVPAGYVDDTDCNSLGQLDSFRAMRREINEEVGITENQINNLICVGAAKNSDVSNVEVLFIGRTNLKSTDIVDRSASDVKKRLLLKPKDIEGDIRPRKILGSQGDPTHVLPALLKIDQVFGKTKKHGTPGPELIIPTSQALFFLVDKMLKEK